MRLVYTDQAYHDFAEIAAYIAHQSGYPELGEEFAKKLQSACKKLSETPCNIGKKCFDLRKGLYRYVYGNYLIFYSVDDEELTVISVLEGHRDVGALFEEK